MWSVWRERVDAYLGTGVALVRRHDRELVRLEYSATLPLKDALAQLDDLCGRDTARPWSLHVLVSALLCPAVPFTLPAGVKRWSEAMAVAQAAAAKTWNLPPEQSSELVCSIDLHRKDLAAAMMMGTQQQIQEWADLKGGRLASLQPLWSVAASAPGCRQKNVQRVTVREPDGMTDLIEPHAPGSTATPASGVDLQFSAQVLPHRQQWAQAPSNWAGHWELLV